MTTRQLSEDVVVTGIGGSAMIGQLDHDIVDTEEINQVMELGLSLSHPLDQALPHCSLPTSGEDSPVLVGHLGQMVEIMDRMPFLPTLGQIGVRGHRPSGDSPPGRWPARAGGCPPDQPPRSEAPALQWTTPTR